jgi:hypothetical protein
LSEAIANGTAVRLEAGQSLGHRLLAIAYEGMDRVGGITPEGVVLPRL